MADYVSKRRSPRRRFRRVIGLLHQGDYSVTQLLEIGEGGLMVLAPEKEIAVNDGVVVTFSLEGHKQVSTRTEVRYEVDHPDGGKALGLQFLNLELSYRRFIRSFVAQKTLEEAREDQARLSEDQRTFAFSVDERGRPKPTVL